MKFLSSLLVLSAVAFSAASQTPAVRTGLEVLRERGFVGLTGKNPFTLADPARLTMFDRVAGSDRIRALFSKRMKYADVAEELKKGVEEFRSRSARYLLY